MGVSEYIQFVSRTGFQVLRALWIERESRAAWCNEQGTAAELLLRPIRKKVDGEVAYGDI